MLNFALITHSKQKTNKKQFYLCWFRIETTVNFSSSFVWWKQPPSIISYTLTPTVNSGLIKKNAFVGSKCSWLMLLELFFTIPTLQLERLSYAFAQHTVYLCVFLFSQCAFDFVSFHNFTQFSHSSHNLKNLLVVRGKKNMIKMHKETISRLFVRSALCSYFLNLCVVFHDLFCFVLFVSNLGFPSKLFFFFIFAQLESRIRNSITLTQKSVTTHHTEQPTWASISSSVWREKKNK